MANRSSQSICNNSVLNPKSQFLQLNFGKYPIVAVNPNGDKKLRMDLDYGVDRYESLILVAGGIGITPFIAILRDLLHRHQRQQPNPRDLTLIWAVKKSKELQILDLVSLSSICPDYDMKLNLNVQLFVTQEEAEAEPVISHEHRITHTSGFKDVHYSSKESCILSSLYNLEASKKPVSNLVGTGSVFWVGLSLIASFIGYIIVRSFLDHCYYSHGRVSWSLQGFFSVVSLVLGTVVFGGTVVALWKRSDDQIKVVDSESTQGLINVDDDSTILANECGDHLVFPSDTHIGQRPNLKGDKQNSPCLGFQLLVFSI
jgi:hypothetical protein